MIIFAATKNSHKLQEINIILKEINIEVKAYPDLPDIEENGKSFEENSSIKSDFLSNLLPDNIVIADDSGIEVEALNNAPGIYSARYAGIHGDDKANNQKLLDDMKNIDNRKCRFVSVISLSKNGKTIQTFRGEVYGELAFDEKGSNGFGYDPLFVLPNKKRMSELSSEEKNEISHRKKALNLLKEYLKNHTL